MTRSPAIDLMVGLIAPFVAVVVLDLILVPIDVDIASVAAGCIMFIAVFATPILFFRFFRAVPPRRPPDVGAGLIVLCTVIALPPWLYVAMTVYANIHLALGGSL